MRLVRVKRTEYSYCLADDDEDESHVIQMVALFHIGVGPYPPEWEVVEVRPGTTDFLEWAKEATEERVESRYHERNCPFCWGTGKVIEFERVHRFGDIFTNRPHLSEDPCELCKGTGEFYRWYVDDEEEE